MSWPHRAEDCAQLLALGDGIAAVDGDGSTIGVGLRWSFGRDVGTIGLVLVAPEQQGRGIGRALMNALIANSGSRTLMLNATAEGLPLYEKLGFVSTGFVRQHQGRLAEGAVLPPRRPSRCGAPCRRTTPPCAPSTPPSSAPTVRRSSAGFWRAAMRGWSIAPGSPPGLPCCVPSAAA